MIEGSLEVKLPTIWTDEATDRRERISRPTTTTTTTTATTTATTTITTTTTTTTTTTKTTTTTTTTTTLQRYLLRYNATMLRATLNSYYATAVLRYYTTTLHCTALQLQLQVQLELQQQLQLHYTRLQLHDTTPHYTTPDYNYNCNYNIYNYTTLEIHG